ncbi:MAG: HEAT repeat domain-containing protein, partial [Bacteroidota bacterium]
ATRQEVAVRSVIVNSLKELSQAVPEHGDNICRQLLTLAEDKRPDVRGAAITALGTLEVPHRAGAIRSVMLSASASWSPSVRQAAASAIGKRMRDGQALDREHLKALLNLSQEWSSSSVREAAVEALSSFTTRQLIEGYCGGLHNSALVKQLWGRLCAQPLVESLARDRGRYKLTLYQGVGEPITWQAPKAAVDRLKRALRAYNPKVTWGEYLGKFVGC